MILYYGRACHGRANTSSSTLKVESALRFAVLAGVLQYRMIPRIGVSLFEPSDGIGASQNGHVVIYVLSDTDT